MLRKSARFSFVLAALAMAASASSFAADGPILLRVADHYPVSASTPEYTIKHFMEAVTKATNGAVRFEYYPAEQLGKAKDLLSLTQQGVIDIGMVAPAYVSDKMPLSAVAELPGSFTTSCQGAEAYWKLANGGIIGTRELHGNGIHPLFVFVLPPYQILTRAKFTGLADLKGLKLRSAGGAMDLTIRRLDAVAIRMGGADVYPALSRGTIDGIVFPLSPVLEFKLQDYLKYGTIGENFGGFAVTYSISEKRWDGLPKEVQQAMKEAGDETTRHACAMLDRDNGPAIDLLRKAGLQMSEMPAADHASIHERLAPVQAEWADALEKRGLPGHETLNAFLAAISSP
jgi:TRAP-type C4-dicarboxylate transport system substrate-binding protein